MDTSELNSDSLSRLRIMGRNELLKLAASADGESGLGLSKFLDMAGASFDKIVVPAIFADEMKVANLLGLRLDVLRAALGVAFTLITMGVDISSEEECTPYLASMITSVCVISQNGFY